MKGLNRQYAPQSAIAAGILPARNRFAVLLLAAALTAVALLSAVDSSATRIKDLASVQGVRDNQLIGYGLVVGLNGTGDGNQAAFTTRGLLNVMNNMGMPLNKDDIKVKNVAGVMISATLPPFAKVGQAIDVVVSSLGDASSLQGGTLVATPLKGLDGKVYGMAQGPVSIGGFEVAGGSTQGRQKNHLTVARVPGGATVEREVPVSFAGKDVITLNLDAPDFTTTARMSTAVDEFLQGDYANSRDGATVDVTIPDNYRDRVVAFVAALENLEIVPDAPAKVVLDERTGTVVMGENVQVSQLAVSHGTLSLQVTAAGGGQQRLVPLEQGASLGEVVRALNAIGVAPRDLIAIFLSIKASGSLQAELEVI